MTKKQQKILDFAIKTIPNFNFLSNKEKVLQIVAILCDKIKVREDHGNNSGYWVDDFLEVTGVPIGSPWCASMLFWVFDMLDLPRPKNGASVANWITWAREHNLITTKPERGDLCAWLNKNGTGHIGDSVSFIPGLVNSIEGNTTPGPLGNQREGGGCYRRRRMKKTWQYFIKIM